MKKNFIVKVMTLVMAVTMALTPVTASAAEKKVVTAKEFSEFYDDACLASFGYDVKASKENAELRKQWLSNVDDEWLGDASALKAKKKYLKLVESMNGCYQENGNKIYTALNGKTVTFKKTGNYSVIVGGKTAKKDEGTFKFVAPKTGTYKFTFTTKDNVAGGQIFLDQHYVGKDYLMSFKVDYRCGSEKIKRHTSVYVTNNPDRCAYPTLGKGVLSRYEDCYTSEMTKVSGSIKLKKGQKVSFTGRACDASYDEPNSCAYNFTGFDVKITKTK